MVDEHGRPPGAPSRTGPGHGPPADPARVDRARAQEKREKASEMPPAATPNEPPARPGP
ncbi:hypothetical protein AB0D66_17850 [Streptomyces sp. NPDC048270]|uniref:hypothetical protein n=1 Tax=Streptomyces sp. NPDC048270 TaxID=3154615 RepID=UPI00340D60B1